MNSPFKSPRKTAGISFFQAFKNNFIRPYGSATNANQFSNATVLRQVNTYNCEFLKRPTIALSELAETLLANNVSINLPGEERYNRNINKIRDALNVINSKSDSTGDVDEAYVKLQKFLTDENDFVDAYLEQSLEALATAYLPLIWLKVARVLFRHPTEMFSMAELDNGNFQNFKVEKTIEAYMNDAKGEQNRPPVATQSTSYAGVNLLSLPDSDEEEIEEPTHSRRRLMTPDSQFRQPAPSPRQQSPGQGDSTPANQRRRRQDSEQSSPEPTTPKRRRRRSRNIEQEQTEDNDSDEAVVGSPRVMQAPRIYKDEEPPRVHS